MVTQNYAKGAAAMRGAASTTLIGSIVGGLAVVALVAFLIWFFACPCGQTPGGYLSGEVIEEPVNDWSFANQVELCQIQVDTGLLPHALNMNCWAGENGAALYLSCAQCDGKRWSTALVETGQARMRLDGNVYPVQGVRVTDAEQLDMAWRERALKLQALSGNPGSNIPERPDHWWSFRMVSR